MRRCHYLKANHKSESPSAVIYFDTETRETKLSDTEKRLDLSFGFALYTRRIASGKWGADDWTRFETLAGFWSFVEAHARPKTKLYVIAHNLIFDLTITHGFKELPARGWKLTKAIIDDPPSILVYRKDKMTLCLIDSFNYFHSSLAELGESIGLSKLTMPGEGATPEEWDVYCRRDVEVLRAAMESYIEFVKHNDLGNFQLTQASQAFNAYRHRFMHHAILIDCNDKALELARNSYYGGRTEAFYLGETEGDFYLLDVNSMYPFVMSVFEYPTILQSVYHRVTVPELAEIIEASLVIGDVDLSTDEPAYPLRRKDGLVFPVGSFRAALPTPELKYALEHGHIKRVRRLALYRGARLFEDYVTTLYNLRRDYKAAGNKPFQYLCKLMLNSLYGKFGQCGRVYTDSGAADSLEPRSWDEWDADRKCFVKYRQFGGLVQSYKNEGESYNSSPAIASHVTGYARAWLWKLICQAGRENVYYCDTDSILTNKAGYDILAPLYVGDSLGELKLERRFASLRINGPKDYRFGETTKIKGIRKNAVKLGDNVYSQERFSKFKGMVARGDLESMVITDTTKTLRRRYHKGERLDSGRIAPLHYKLSPAGENVWDTSSIDPAHYGQFDPRYQEKRVRAMPERDILNWRDDMERRAGNLDDRRCGRNLRPTNRPYGESH